MAQRALALVQKLDPPGVGARDLRECLLLQLVPGIPYYEQLHTLIANHLEDLEHNRLPVISRKTGYSIELIQNVLGELRKLNPKPGADYNNIAVPPVTPDVFVELDEDGQYRVRLEEGDTPSLFISPYYRRLFQNPDTSEETREYIKRKINSAQWLIDSIEQRRNTLLKVARAIVDYQKQFLDKGPEAIEPLKMQQIADQVGVHVTTVSRAVDEKWIQTPRGIFPLKRFFCGGTTSADGEEVAWDTVRLKLQEIVDSEDKQHPWSDDQLVQQLAAAGITVARRTVTKYRKAMGILSSRQRRDWGGEKKSRQVMQQWPGLTAPERACNPRFLLRRLFAPGYFDRWFPRLQAKLRARIGGVDALHADAGDAGERAVALADAAADAQVAIDVRLLNLHLFAVLILDRDRLENLDGLVRRRAHLLATDARGLLGPRQAAGMIEIRLAGRMGVLSSTVRRGMAPVGQTWPQSVHSYSQLLCSKMKRGSSRGENMPATPASNTAGCKTFVGQTFMHSPQRMHRSRNVFSSSAPGGRSKCGSTGDGRTSRTADATPGMPTPAAIPTSSPRRERSTGRGATSSTASAFP